MEDHPTPLSSRLNRTHPTGSAARRHGETMMLAAVERRQRAADILADGLVKLLRDDGRIDRLVDGNDPKGEVRSRHARPQLHLVPDPEKETQ